MKLKYRIKKINTTKIDSIFVAQYRIFGAWLNINDRLIGKFTLSAFGYCDFFCEAFNRINQHKKKMKRAYRWFDVKSTTIVWKDNDDI